MQMTKNDLINNVTQLNGIDREIAKKAVNEVIESIKASLRNGEDVTLRGLGTLKVVRRKEKLVRNIGKGTTFIKPAWNKPVFVPSKNLVDELN